MNFLRDQKLPLDSESSMDIHRIGTADGDEENEEQRSDSRASINEIQNSTLSDTSPRTMSVRASKKVKKSEKLIDLAYERLNEVKDEYHHWGIACAADLRKMERTQQFYAKKAIAEIIMEGQLGLLHRHSVQTNENFPPNSSIQFGASPSPQYSNYTPSPSHIKSPAQPPIFRNPTPSPSYSNPSPSYSNPLPVYANPLPVYANPSHRKITVKLATPSPDTPVNPIPSSSYEQYNILPPSPSSAQMVTGPESAQIVTEYPVINIPNLQSIGEHQVHNLNENSQLLQYISSFKEQ